jgi:hypothetical protein
MYGDFWKKAILWENGLGGLGRFERIFFDFLLKIQAFKSKKSVPIRQIRPIRFPIVSLFPKIECKKL